MNEKKLDDFKSDEVPVIDRLNRKKWIVREMTIYECPVCGNIRKEPWVKCHMCGANFILPSPLDKEYDFDDYFWHDPDIGPDGKPFESESGSEDTGRDGENPEA